MYRIHEIKLNINQEKDVLIKKIARKLRINPKDITEYRIIRESIDARDKGDIKLVYTVDFKCEKSLDLPKAPDMIYRFSKTSYSKEKRPVIVGFGPCGIFAALTLVDMGYKPIVLERGKSVEERSIDVEKFWNEGILDEESNVQFGEGGAGTFSDGKLTTGIKDVRIRKVLEDFYRFGAKEEILYKHKPHIGTDVLKKIVSQMREYIISKGGEVRFSSKVTDIIAEDGVLTGLEVEHKGEKYILDCDRAAFAIGHSARDTFYMMYENGVNMAQKPFSIGVRIEHPQEIIDKVQYGNAAIGKKLGAADYKLNCKTSNGRGVYTFCMCPGGVVVMASSEKNTVVTNGMSYSKRDGEFANSALLVDVRVSDFNSQHPLAGVKFQRKYEKKAFEIKDGYEFPICYWEDFKDSDVAKCLPEFAAESILEAVPVMARKLKGFDMPKAIIKGVETRSSSPVRILRDNSMESNIKGIYPSGEGAGYAGGIVSAAVDGIKIAEKIMETE